MTCFYIDVKTSKLTMSELISEVDRLQALHPDQDVHLSGDLHAVIGTERVIA